MSDRNDARILIVDDEEEIVDLYATYLEPEYDVETATSGREALEIADESIEVVLLDRRMPDLSGDQVLETLRERELGCQVAMLTAVEPDTDIIDMPFDDYEIKPVVRSDLVGLVEVLSKRSSYDDQSQEYFSLASKKAALEIAGNDGTEEYEQLVDRMDSLRDDIDTILDEIGAEAAFSELSAD